MEATSIPVDGTRQRVAFLRAVADHADHAILTPNRHLKIGIGKP